MFTKLYAATDRVLDFSRSELKLISLTFVEGFSSLRSRGRGVEDHSVPMTLLLRLATELLEWSWSEHVPSRLFHGGLDQSPEMNAGEVSRNASWGNLVLERRISSLSRRFSRRLCRVPRGS